MLDTGASGYIGGMWSLVDRAAAEFSARFYKEVEHGMKRGPVSVFAALREARRLFYDTGDPTFLDHAYVRDVNLRFARNQLTEGGIAESVVGWGRILEAPDAPGPWCEE